MEKMFLNIVRYKVEKSLAERERYAERLEKKRQKILIEVEKKKIR